MLNTGHVMSLTMHQSLPILESRTALPQMPPPQHSRRCEVSDKERVCLLEQPHVCT